MTIAMMFVMILMFTEEEENKLFYNSKYFVLVPDSNYH